MNWTIPGTTLTATRADAANIDRTFHSMFLPGGMVLSQVSAVTGLEPHMIQNWVKRGFLPPPQGKRYSMEHVCRIININMLRGALPLEKICSLLTYINGNLADESDDLVDDTALYFMFVKLAARARHISGDEPWDLALQNVTADYREPVPGAREKLKAVLRIMLTAWIAAQLRTQAESMLEQL